MKTMKMISRRSFLKAAMAAATVSALGLTGCGSSASSTASSTASSADVYKRQARRSRKYAIGFRAQICYNRAE